MSSNLDINTKKGQVSLSDERLVAKWVEQKFDVSYIETPKDSPATVDAIILKKDNTIQAVIETKCRYNLTLEAFNSKFSCEWLVTWEKIRGAIKISSGLGVPCVGFLYLVEPKILLVKKLAFPDGKLSSEIRLSTTETQATINGGLANRTNAFILMRDAKVYKLD